MKQLYTVLTVSALLGLPSALHGDTVVTASVHGVTLTKDVVKITFDGDNAILHYSDTSTETADMTHVTLTLTHEEQTSIDNIQADTDKPAGVYNLLGQRLGDTPEGLAPGVYIINGQKVLVK